MKSNLKESIIETAIELFNEEGFSSVTIRDIASKLSISPGSLTYHFKKKKDIVIEIHNQMKKEFLTNIQLNVSDLTEFDKQLDRWCDLQWKYMFVFCDFIVLTRTYPELQKFNSTLFDYYKNHLKVLLKILIEDGLVRPEPVVGTYENIADALNIVLPMTVSINNIIYRDEFTQEKIKTMIWSLIIPILSEKGLKVYKNIR